MTHYWWMHWFWITLWMSINCCEDTLHSNSTNIPPLNVTSNLTNVSERYETPSTTASYSLMVKNITTPKTVPITKTSKPSFKKTNMTSWMLSVANKTAKEIKKSVIIQKNSTDTNITDNQLLLNSSFNAINDTNNITYVEEEISYNQSLIRNPQRIHIEEEEEEHNITGGNLSAAGITGITLACVIIVGLISGISYFLYHNRGSNRPQVLNDRCSNPDSSGYIDDASVRDNSEEMYSLDNDSFLNSLEAMTIQNYWTDTVKHTKL